MDCSICFSEITGATGRTILGCKHEFHLRCVVTWLQTGAGCPYCRAATGEYETLSTSSSGSIESIDDIEEDESSMTPLMIAARNDDCAEIEALLAAGANIEEPDPELHTSLCYAVMNLSDAAATLLLERGASLAPLSVLTTDPGDGSLGFALLGCCCYVSIPCLVRLLEKGADPNFTSPISGLTPLMEVAHSGCRDSDMEAAVRLLLVAGADVGRKDKDGWTALNWFENEGLNLPVIYELLTPVPAPRRSQRIAWLCTA